MEGGIRLVVDWDGTITKKDTLHLVSAIGYDNNSGNNLTPWDNIVKAYLSEYAEHQAEYMPPAERRKTVAEESEWLASLKFVERRSIDRVKEAGIFNGISKEKVISASRSAVKGEKLQLRPGWRRLLMQQEILETQRTRNSPVVSILSVNWSATFIRACLEAAFSGSSTSEDRIMDSIPVHANELLLGDAQEGPHICTSADKLGKFEEVRRDGGGVMIYVGDSGTDFDCLIAADVGICVRDEPMGGSQKELKAMLDRVGIKTLRLTSEAFRRSRDEEKKIVWWVGDLDEISNFVEEIS